MPKKRYKYLGIKWKLRLGDKYQNWIVTDCGGNGDCFFASLGFALDLDSNQIRQQISEQITEKNWSSILQMYQIQQQYDTFEDDWDPTTVKTLNEFKELVKQPKILWGDHNLICLAQKAFHINIIPLQRQRGKSSFVYNHLDFDISRNKNVFLDYLFDKQHFRLTGHHDAHVKYCFNNHEIPPEMKDIVLKDIGIRI